MRFVNLFYEIKNFTTVLISNSTSLYNRTHFRKGPTDPMNLNYGTWKFSYLCSNGRETDWVLRFHKTELNEGVTMEERWGGGILKGVIIVERNNTM